MFLCSGWKRKQGRILNPDFSLGFRSENSVRNSFIDFHRILSKNKKFNKVSTKTQP
jgi:hypothetical protein